MIFDTHAHYDDKQFDQDREELLASMKDNGIGTIVDVGSNMETSTWIVEAVTRYPMMYNYRSLFIAGTQQRILMI